jgi:hypothetical protein
LELSAGGVVAGGGPPSLFASLGLGWSFGGFVAGCGPPSLFASLGLGWSFGGFVAGVELLVAGEVWAVWLGVCVGLTLRRPGVSWEKSRAVVQRKSAGRYTRNDMSGI